METSYDYIEGSKLIVFWEGEDPEDEIPDGWEVVERTEPYPYKGYTNPGTVICRPVRK